MRRDMKTFSLVWHHTLVILFCCLTSKYSVAWTLPRFEPNRSVFKSSARSCYILKGMRNNILLPSAFFCRLVNLTKVPVEWLWLPLEQNCRHGNYYAEMFLLVFCRVYSTKIYCIKTKMRTNDCKIGKCVMCACKKEKILLLLIFATYHEIEKKTSITLR